MAHSTPPSDPADAPATPGPETAGPSTPAAGPPSPFGALPEPLARALAKRGFDELTTVQKAVAAAETDGRDLRISSRTGSGKTVAVGIAIGRELLGAGARERGDGPRPGPSVLVLTPTRELAAQVQRELVWLLNGVPDCFVEVVTGGTSVGLDRKNLSKGPRVLVGTPGRVLDHLTSGVFKPEGVSMVVLDEADQMLDLGFRDELEAILEKLPTPRRTHLVSATFSGDAARMAARFQQEPVNIEGSPLGAANADIEHIAHVVPYRQRYDALVNVLLEQIGLSEDDEPPRTLVFTRTRADTGDIAAALSDDGFRAEPLSGEMAQAARTRTLNGFRRGQIQILVATDVAARGLDVEDVGLVIHADPPGDAEALTHRSGRTGRAGKKGQSVLILPPQARGRVQRMLGNARIAPAWQPVPTDDRIRKLFVKRGRRKLWARLELEPSTGHIEQARRVLAEHDAERVVATLLAATDEAPPCSPRKVEHRPEIRGPRDNRGPRAPGRAFGGRNEHHGGAGAGGGGRPRGPKKPGWGPPRGDRPRGDRPRSDGWGPQRPDRPRKPGKFKG